MCYFSFIECAAYYGILLLTHSTLILRTLQLLIMLAGQLSMQLHFMADLAAYRY